MGDFRTTTGEPLPLPKRERRLRRTVRLGTAAIILAALVWAGLHFRLRRYAPAAGYVTTERYAEVRSPTVGVVAEIKVRSGETVQKGDLLVQLDDSEEQATLEEVRSQERKAEAQLSRREAEIEESKRMLAKDIDVARLRLKDATTKVLRTKELLKKGLVAASALEDAQLKEKLAQAELTSLQNRDLSVFEKELAVLREEVRARREAVLRAEAQVKAKQVRAPISGTVLRYEFVIGELVRPEQVLYEIFGGNELILKLRVAERYATRIAVGQPCKARLAPFSAGLQRVWFDGRVEHLRNVIQAEGKQTYRVAYCSFDPRDYQVPPGTTAEARIYYGRAPALLVLLGLD